MADQSIKQVQRYLKQEENSERRVRFLLPMLSNLPAVIRQQEATGFVADIQGLDVASLQPYQAAVFQNQLGTLLQLMGKHDESIAAHHRAIKFSRLATNERGVTMGTLHLAEALRFANQPDAAIDLLQQRLDSGACDLVGRARIANHLALLLIETQDYEEAGNVLLDCLRCEDELGGTISSSKAIPLQTRGHMYLHRGRFPEAIPLFLEALRLEQQNKNVKGQMFVLHSLAQAELGCRNLYKAESYVLESLRFEEKQPRPYHKCQLFHTHAKILKQKGDDPAAVSTLVESMEIADHGSEQPRFTKHRIHIRCQLAAIRLQEDNHTVAKRLLNEASAIADKSPYVNLRSYVALCIAKMQQATGLGDAEETLHQALDGALKAIRELNGDRELVRIVNQLLAGYRQATNDDAAQKLLERVLRALATRQDNPRHLQRMSRIRRVALCALGQLILRTDQTRGAIQVDRHYRESCEAAIDDQDFATTQALLVDWVTAIAARGEAKRAGEKLTEYINRLDSLAPPDVVYHLALRRAELLATIARRQRRVPERMPRSEGATAQKPSTMWHEAIDACLDAERLFKKTDAFYCDRSPMIRAAMLLDTNQMESAKTVLMDCYATIEQQTMSRGKGANSGLSDFKVQDSYIIEFTELWSKINLKESIELLNRLAASDVISDPVAIASLKARLLRDKFPYSAEQALIQAYNMSCEEQDIESQAQLATALGQLFQHLQQHENAEREFCKAVELRKSLVWVTRLAIAMHCACCPFIGVIA